VFGYRVKDGQQQDAEVFLGHYLDALDEELVGLYTYISTHKPASAPSAGELEDLEETQSAVGKAEVGKRDYNVR
jgi:ubiquitin carboxyl-terminal hydrolase 10